MPDGTLNFSGNFNEIPFADHWASDVVLVPQARMCTYIHLEEVSGGIPFVAVLIPFQCMTKVRCCSFLPAVNGKLAEMFLESSTKPTAPVTVYRLPPSTSLKMKNLEFIWSPILFYLFAILILRIY